ncbi:phosphoribosyltransferase, partial [Bdellovibrionota bacterium]
MLFCGTMNEPKLTQLYSREQIDEMVSRLGQELTRDYKGKDLVVVGILKGAMMFLADLTRKIDVPLEVDFVRLYSYGSSTTSSGTVKISKDIECEIE